MRSESESDSLIAFPSSCISSFSRSSKENLLSPGRAVLSGASGVRPPSAYHRTAPRTPDICIDTCLARPRPKALIGAPRPDFEAVRMRVQPMYRPDPNTKFGRFLGHVVPGVVKPLHILWNEVIGFFFFIFALLPARAIVRDWQAFNQTGENLGKLVLEAIWVLVMTYFALSSFLKARKISRS